MPYASDAQRRYFNANREELEAQGVDVDEWNSSSRGKKLPEKVKDGEPVKTKTKKKASTDWDARLKALEQRRGETFDQLMARLTKESGEISSVYRRLAVSKINLPADMAKQAAVSVLRQAAGCESPHSGSNSVLEGLSDGSESPESGPGSTEKQGAERHLASQPLYLTKVALSAMRKDHMLVGPARRSWQRNRVSRLKQAMAQAPQGAVSAPPADAVSLLRGATAPNPMAAASLSPQSQQNPYVGAPGGVSSPSQNPINSYGPLNQAGTVGGGMFGQADGEGPIKLSGNSETEELAELERWNETATVYDAVKAKRLKKLQEKGLKGKEHVKLSLDLPKLTPEARKALTGALLGAGGGVVYGGVFGDEDDSFAQRYLGPALAGAGMGGLGGGLVGSINERQRLEGNVGDVLGRHEGAILRQRGGGRTEGPMSLENNSPYGSFIGGKGSPSTETPWWSAIFKKHSAAAQQPQPAPQTQPPPQAQPQPQAAPPQQAQPAASASTGRSMAAINRQLAQTPKQKPQVPPAAPLPSA